MTNKTNSNLKTYSTTQEGISKKDDNFVHEQLFKPKLSTSELSLKDIKLYLLIKFGTYSKASDIAGITSDRLHQIFMGYSIPQSPDKIKNLAKSWDIDLVILSQIFERCRS